MRRTLLTIGILLTGLASLQAQQYASDTIYFDFDQYNLQYEYRVTMDSLIAEIRDYPSYYIEVLGHTDSIGTEGYNQRLSEQRAQVVVDFLIEQGLMAERISMQGFGTTRPVASNATFAGRQRNRRAEIAAIYTDQEGLVQLGLEGQGVAGAAGEGGETETDEDGIPLSGDMDLTGPGYEREEEAPRISRTDTIYAEYDPFKIVPYNTTYIFAPQGTKIVIQPNSFDTEEEEIDFQVGELFLRKDILMAGMPTVSKDGPLETEGMVNIEASEGGRRVRVRENKPIEIEVPAEDRDEGMSLYLGKGGERGARRRVESREEMAFPAVRSWTEAGNLPLAYSSQDRRYRFQLTDLGRVAIARPLYVAEGTPREDEGVDLYIKLKGKRFESRTSVFLTGQYVQTYVPLTKMSKRKYEGNKIRHFSPDMEVVLVATQYDNDDEPFLAMKRFVLEEELKTSKKSPRPYAKLKIKFKRMSQAEFEDALSEL